MLRSQHGQPVLRWTARIVSLLAAAVLFYYWIPVLLAVIAWRWHLVGGVLLTLASVVGVVRLAQIHNSDWSAYLVLMLLLVGGTLHIIVALRQKRDQALLA